MDRKSAWVWCGGRQLKSSGGSHQAALAQIQQERDAARADATSATSKLHEREAALQARPLICLCYDVPRDSPVPEAEDGVQLLGVIAAFGIPTCHAT